MYGLCYGSLGSNNVGDAGAAAIGAGLVHVPQLQALKCVVCPAVCSEPPCVLAREGRLIACECAGVVVCAVCVHAAFYTTISVTWVRRSLVQACCTCPSCRHWSTLCARLCARGRGVCLRGDGVRVRWSSCERGLFWCSLANNRVGDVGAAAIGAGLVHLPQLQTLGYVVRPAVCARLGRVLAWKRGTMA